MYSCFDGLYKARPNVSLAGASKQPNKSSFLEKLKFDREEKEVIP